MSLDELYKLTWGDYMRICLGHQQKEIDTLSKLRMILGAQVGKDPRDIIRLPIDDIALEKVNVNSEENSDHIKKRLKKLKIDHLLGLN